MLQSMLHFPESDGETGKLKKVQYIVKTRSLAALQVAKYMRTVKECA